jgi:hypothetical protein
MEASVDLHGSDVQAVSTAIQSCHVIADGSITTSGTRRNSTSRKVRRERLRRRVARYPGPSRQTGLCEAAFLH